jgi:hypothetical protein
VVRPGLVVVGVVFAIVGGALFTSFYFASSSTPSDARSSSVALDLSANQSLPWTFTAIGSGTATFTLAWTATGGVNVSFAKSAPCSTTSTGLCPVAPPLVSWTGSVHGRWTGNGPSGTTYLVTVGDAAGRALVFNATLSESYAGPGFSTTIWILIIVGSILLLGTGAIGVFLGLFLPSGVYERDASLGRYSEQLAEGGEYYPEDPDDPNSPVRFR